MDGHPFALLLFFFITIQASSQSACFQGSLLSSVKEDFKLEGRSLARKNDALCRVIINYDVDVDTCELKSLDGWAGEETIEPSFANKCILKSNLFPKSIVCYCPEDNCNKLDKFGLQDQLNAFRAQLQEKPKSNAVVIHEVSCLLQFLKPEDETKQQTEATTENQKEKGIFENPLHCALFIVGVILAVLAIAAILLLLVRSFQKKATKNMENHKNTEISKITIETESGSGKEAKKSTEETKNTV